MNPGSKVIVPDDESGDCVFVRPGDQYEAIEVDDPAGGRHTRDVGLVKYPDGCIKPWPYAKIRAPIAQASSRALVPDDDEQDSRVWRNA